MTSLSGIPTTSGCSAGTSIGAPATTLDRTLTDAAAASARYRRSTRALEDVYEHVAALADAEFPTARLDGAAARHPAAARAREPGSRAAVSRARRRRHAPRARLAVAAALIRHDRRPAWSASSAGAAGPVSSSAHRGDRRCGSRAQPVRQRRMPSISNIDLALRSPRHARSCRRSTSSRRAPTGSVPPTADGRSRLMPPLIFRKGLDLKAAVAGQLAENYHSALVGDDQGGGYTFQAGRLTLHLAREFGFCYGVDRAVDYAYQARTRFPDQTVFLTGEIIHNPHVNDKLRALGIRFLSDAGETLDRADGGRRRHPAGLWRDDRDAAAALGARLHAGRHDLRLGAQRLEEREALRAGRPDLGHPRQALARGNASHGVSGAPSTAAAATWSSTTRPKRTSSATTSAARRRSRAPSSSGSATRPRRVSIPTSTSAASGWPTRRRC